MTESGAVDNLSENKWKLVHSYATVLAPFAQATNDLCGEKYPTLSMKISAISMLRSNLSKFVSEPANRGYGILLARHLLTALDKRFPSYKTVMPDCICILLDPRYKKVLHIPEEKKLCSIKNERICLHSFASYMHWLKK